MAHVRDSAGLTAVGEVHPVRHPIFPSPLCRAVVAFLAAATIIGLTPVADSDAADPTWIAGYWDDDDFDNAAVFIVAPYAIDGWSPVGSKPLFAPVARLAAIGPVDRQPPLRPAVFARAPPVAPRASLLINH
jgi:hypothetical protein